MLEYFQKLFRSCYVPLSKEHLQNVCRLGQEGKNCIFITFGPEGFTCAKKSALENTIRARRATMNAQSENCSGPPDFIIRPESVEEN